MSTGWEQVGWRWTRWVSVRLGWSSSFPVVVRIPYDGFLLGFGVVTPETGKTPGRTILEVLEVVGTRYRVQTGGFVGDIGVDGGDGGDSNGIGC